MPSTTPLTDAINALTTYANETTGESDTTLSDAVGSLVAGYGGGGTTTVASGTFTGDGTNPTSGGGGILVGNKMPKTNFWVKIKAQSDSEFTYDTYYKYSYMFCAVYSDMGHFDLSTVGDSKQLVSDLSINIDNSGTVSAVTSGTYIAQMTTVRNNSANNYGRPNNVKIDRKTTGFYFRIYNSNASYYYENGIKYDWELVYFGSDPTNDIVQI